MQGMDGMVGGRGVRSRTAEGSEGRGGWWERTDCMGGAATKREATAISLHMTKIDERIAPLQPMHVVYLAL